MPSWPAALMCHLPSDCFSDVPPSSELLHRLTDRPDSLPAHGPVPVVCAVEQGTALEPAPCRCALPRPPPYPRCPRSYSRTQFEASLHTICNVYDFSPRQSDWKQRQVTRWLALLGQAWQLHATSAGLAAAVLGWQLSNSCAAPWSTSCHAHALVTMQRSQMGHADISVAGLL